MVWPVTCNDVEKGSWLNSVTTCVTPCVANNVTPPGLVSAPVVLAVKSVTLLLGVLLVKTT